MISVVCVYNNERILKDCLLKSLETQTSKYELILLDNTQGKYKSAAGALNGGGGKAKGNYIMFVHQDVDLYSNTWLAKVEKLLNTIPNLGIAGVGGSRRSDGPERVETVTNIKQGIPPMNVEGTVPLQKPEKVQTLDECLVLLPRSVFDMLQFDEKVCDDWHLYAVDYSLSMARLGLDVYVIPASIYHRSTGVPNNKDLYEQEVWQSYLLRTFFSAGFYRTLRKLLEKHKRHTRHIYATTGCWSTSRLSTLSRVTILRKAYFKAGVWRLRKK